MGTVKRAVHEDRIQVAPETFKVRKMQVRKAVYARSNFISIQRGANSDFERG